MDYKYYVVMIRRSIKRINSNLKNKDDKMSLFNTGIEIKHIEAIIDEAYDLDNITYNSFKLLRKWYNKYYAEIVHKIIWL